MACRYMSNGNGECFCTVSDCNTEALVYTFIQNYEDGVLDCIGGTCKDSDTVCYISASGKLVKINMTFFGMLLLKRSIFLLHNKQD